MSRLSHPVRGAVLALVALATVAAPSAHAQALPPFDYSQYDVLLGTLGISNLPAGRDRADEPPRRPRQAPRRPTARQRAALRFRPSAAVTQRLYREVVEGSGQDAAVVAAQLDAAKAEYRRVLVQFAGWRVNDLADAAAFALVQAYVKIHDVSNPPRRGLALLRRAVADDLASQRGVRRLSDARQQAIAERLELRAIFLISDIVGAQMAQDEAAEARALAAFRAWARGVYGVDVARVRLTRNGLVKR
jgi:hypothetical protein